MAYQLLVADDSVTIRKAVELTFAGEDFQLTCVSNGQAAIDKAREIKPHAVLVDAGMAPVDGDNVCQAIRGDPSTSATPLLLMVSNQAPLDEGRARDLGLAGHVVKPFETQALVDRVKTLVGLPVSAPGAAPAVA